MAKPYHEMSHSEQETFQKKITSSFKQRADDYREYTNIFIRMCNAIKQFAKVMPDTSKVK